MKIVVTKLIVGFICVVCLSGSKVFKWTDENGQVHFGSAPTPQNIKSAEETKYSTKSNSPQSLEDVIYGIWYGSIGGQTIRFEVLEEGYQWTKGSLGLVTLGDFIPVSGSWKIEKNRLELIDKKSPSLNKSFLVKKVKRYQMSFIDLKSKQKVTFYKMKPSRENLTEQEELLRGDWRRVRGPNNDKTVGYWSIKYGQISSYSQPQNNYMGSMIHINHNDIETKGNWRIKGENVIIRNVVGFKHKTHKTGKTEVWKLDSLDHRNALLINRSSGERVFLKRKRTK
jgi:hypothetical protein